MRLADAEREGKRERWLGRIAIIGMGLLAVFVIGSLGAHAANAGEQKDLPEASALLRKAAQAIHIQNEESWYMMRIFDADGKESGTRKMHVWFKSKVDTENKLLIKFTEPANIRGTGILTLLQKGETAEQWLYLPAYRKVRRIRKGNENEAFLGSDFSMADISAEHESSFDFKNTGVQKCDKFDCYVLQGTPKADLEKESQIYSKKIIYVRKDSGLNVRTEFYNNDGKLEKVMVLNGVKQDGAKRWVADQIEMKNLLTKTHTTLDFEKRDTEKVPADSTFTQAFLEKGV